MNKSELFLNLFWLSKKSLRNQPIKFFVLIFVYLERKNLDLQYNKLLLKPKD